MLRVTVLGGLSLTEDGRPLAGAAGQPRRLAVLAMLVVAGERGESRDTVVSVLWPEQDRERGRHALTQALYALRRDLGSEDLVLSQGTVRLNPDLIQSDYAEFHQALQGDAPERAVELYRGAFLQGIRLPGADLFQRWVEEQRATLAEAYGRALEAAAGRATERRDPAGAVAYLRRRAAQDPLNPRIAILLMESLAAQGDLVGALQHAWIHEQLRQQELELPADPSVTALASRLRHRAASPEPQVAEPPAPHSKPAPPAPIATDMVADRVPSQEDPPSRSLRWPLTAGLTLVLVALALLIRPPASRQAPGRQTDPQLVVAIGPIVDYTTREGTTPAGRPLADMLATSLARSSGFRVISNGRMVELMQQLRRRTGDSTAIVGRAARQAGAAELIDGALYEITAGSYRLDVRRVDLSSGAMIRTYTLRGNNLLALVDSGTRALAADLGAAIARPQARVAR